MGVKDTAGQGVIDDMGAYNGDSYDSAEIGFNITPNDNIDLIRPTRIIVVGTAGDITYLDRAGNSHLITMPIGQYNVTARRVMATGTTATGLVGLV